MKVNPYYCISNTDLFLYGKKKSNMIQFNEL